MTSIWISSSSKPFYDFRRCRVTWTTCFWPIRMEKRILLFIQLNWTLWLRTDLVKFHLQSLCKPAHFIWLRRTRQPWKSSRNWKRASRGPGSLGKQGLKKSIQRCFNSNISSTHLHPCDAGFGSAVRVCLSLLRRQSNTDVASILGWTVVWWKEKLDSSTFREEIRSERA